MLQRLRALLPIDTAREVSHLVRQRATVAAEMEADAHDADCELQGATQVVHAGVESGSLEEAAELAGAVWKPQPSAEHGDTVGLDTDREIPRQVYSEHCRHLDQEVLNGAVVEGEDGIPRAADGSVLVDTLAGLNDEVMGKYGIS